jgi:uncharacterized protein (DUF1778 family)
MHPNGRRGNVSNKTHENSNLDQCFFVLDAEDHERFVAMLENPTMPSKALRALMMCKPAWER